MSVADATARSPATPFHRGRVALVLSGGGARGAFDAGVVRAVRDRGIEPTILAGTSAGALTAGAVAMGWSRDQLDRFWSEQQTRDVYRPRHDLHRLLRPRRLFVDPRTWLGIGERTATEWLLDLVGWTWLFHLEPLRARLVDEIGGEVLPLRDDVTLVVSTVDVATGELVRIANRPPPGRKVDGLRVEELTVDHLLASAAIPGLFRPIELDGRDHWDGGLASNTPLAAALQHDPDAAIVVASSVPGGQPRPPTSLGDVLALAVEHTFRSAVLTDLDHAETVNELVASGVDTRHRVVELLAVTPDDVVTGLGQILDFEPGRARRFLDDGEQAAHRALDRLVGDGNSSDS